MYSIRVDLLWFRELRVPCFQARQRRRVLWDEYREGLDRLDAHHRSEIRECAQVEAAGGLGETDRTDLGGEQERIELQQVGAATEFEHMKTRRMREGVPSYTQHVGKSEEFQTGETVAECVERGKFA
jgi:hypothetical protein